MLEFIIIGTMVVALFAVGIIEMSRGENTEHDPDSKDFKIKW